MSRKLKFFIALAVFFPVAAMSAEMISWTFYGPGAAGNMQGGGAPAFPDAQGVTGQQALHTLDEVRTGQSRYVTVASARVMRGRWYCIGQVTYTSPQTRQTHVLQNVVGFVHDTGCAFNGTCSCGWLPQFCSGQARPDKMDIALGRFHGWGAADTMQFIVRNPNRAPAQWQLITSLPQPGASGNPAACNGTPTEQGVPVQAPYNPNTINNPYSTFNPFSPYGNTNMMPGGMQPGMPGTYQPQNMGQSFNVGGGEGNQAPAQSTYNPNTSEPVPGGTSVSNILIWPETIPRGGTVSVIWTSVNMAKDSCQVLFDGQEFAKANEGTKPFKIVSSDAPTIRFTLRCQDSQGQYKEVSDSATITD